MSISTLTSVAAQRDTGAPRRSKRKPKNADDAGKTEDRGYLNLLVAAIPTEPLALYTFLIGGIVATIDEGESKRLTLRWVIYGAMIALIVFWLVQAYLRRPKGERARRLPWLETLTAVVAFAAWGLVTPESPLNAELSGDDRIITTLIVTVVGVVLVGGLTGSMKKPAKS